MVTHNDKERAATAVRERRESLGMSQSKYGRVIGRESGTIWSLENQKSTPDFSTLCALVQDGGIPAERLLGMPSSVDGKSGAPAA